MGIVTTSSETAFTQMPAVIYDFVINPVNWTKTYPGSTHISGLPEAMPLRVGDSWTEAGEDGSRIFTWQLAMAMPPRSGFSTQSAGLAMTSRAKAAWKGASPCNITSPAQAAI